MFPLLNFNPRPPCGGRQSHSPRQPALSVISIHVLHVEDDYSAPIYSSELFGFQSTSSMWRTTEVRAKETDDGCISIHVLHVEDDRLQAAGHQQGLDFNPRPPCGGRRAVGHVSALAVNFNPRPPCGGRPLRSPTYMVFTTFQSTSSMWRTTWPSMAS